MEQFELNNASPPKRGRGRPPLAARVQLPPPPLKAKRGRPPLPPKTPPASSDGQLVMFADQAAPPQKYASLADAARHCKVTDRTLKTYFEKYPDLAQCALRARGTRGADSWQIDLEALDGWRRRSGMLLFNDVQLPGEGGTAARPITAQERRASLQSEMLEITLQEKKGNLYDKTEVTLKLRTAMAHFAKTLDNLPQNMGRELGWDGDAIEKMRDSLDVARRTMVFEIGELFLES